MRPIFITGISGLIGGHVWDKLAGREDVWGAYSSSGRLPLSPMRQVYIDLTDPDMVEDVVRELNPRCILHLAAIATLSVCRRQSLLAWRVNHAGTRLLSRLAQDLGSRMILASSDQVFDGQKGGYVETDHASPLNVYGETKKAAERSLFAQVEDAVCVRINNCYGPPRFLGSSFSEWVLRKARRGDPITLFTDQYRSPIDVDTVSSALVELVDHPFRGIIHLGGAERINRVAFGTKLLGRFGFRTADIVEFSAAKHDPHGDLPLDTSFDISLARRTLKTRLLGVDEGIARVYPKAGLPSFNL